MLKIDAVILLFLKAQNCSWQLAFICKIL